VDKLGDAVIFAITSSRAYACRCIGEGSLGSPSFALAVALAAWMRSQDYGWLASLSAAAVTYVVTPFVISQLCAAFVLRRMHRKIRGMHERGK
jgi:hypothetical protein